MLSPEAPRAALGTIVFDGLAYEVNPDGTTVSLVGWHGTAPTGDISIPSQVTSGPDAYTVTAVKIQASGPFADASVESLTLPETIKDIDDGAFESCPSLKYIQVSPRNENFASFDGMLFAKNLERLLSVPEGKEGAAHIPDQTTLVPALSISRCARLSSVEVGEGSAAFASRSGYLYSKDMKTLVASPAGASASVVLPAEVEELGAHAFAGCKNLASVTALGFVREIDSTAFADEAKSAVVALPVGENYDERKAVWEAANFKNFAEPAKPGAIVRPSADAFDGSNSAENSTSEAAASGFVFTLLDDYTLSVAWEGEEDPAATLEIPASADIDGVTYRVSAIASNAFANRGSLTSVKLPAGVTSIGEASFAGCASLASIQLPETLREVGERAFEATALTDLWLPASVQTIGPRAFAACESLTRLVALGTPNVADDALAGCANLSVYCPSNADGAYPWNLGLVANGNHLMPYGLGFSGDPLVLEVGQEADLFEGGFCEAPEGSELSYSYAAKPLSVEAGSVTGKAQGTSEVTAVLTLDGIELARANRTVEVKAPTPEATKTPAPLSFLREEEIFPLSEGDVSLLATGGTAVGSTFTSGNLTYKITSLNPGKVEVTESPSASGNANIPNEVTYGANSYEVAGIGDDAFIGCKSLTGITIPSSVKVIGSEVFSGCSKLGAVTIPDSVTSIGYGVFYNCTSLTSVTLPNSVTVLQDAFFQNCTSLKSIIIPNSVTSIYADAFHGCSSLTSITIPDSVTSLSDNVFDGCSSLFTVTLGSKITSLPWYAFTNNTQLRNIHVRGNVTSIDDEAFYGVTTSNVNVYLSSGSNAKIWTDRGFWVESIGSTFTSGNITYEITSLNPRKVKVTSSPTASGNVNISNRATYGAYGYDVTAIAEGAFHGAKLTSVVIPSSVTAIGGNAFSQCVSLSSVSISSNVTTLEWSVFSECTSLTSITIPNSVTTINEYAFYNCPLSSVTIPASVKTINGSAFNGCASLSAFTVNSSNQNFVSDGGVLYTKNKAELIRYPQGKSGVSFTIPDSVTTIKNDAFYGCSKLTSLSIPNSVTYIGNYAFGSSALTSLTIPDSVTGIGNSIAMNCPITSFTLGSSLSSLPLLNFADLAKLENIYARGNVTSIVSPGWGVSVPTNAKIHLLSGAGKGVWTGAGFNEANITYDAPAPTFENGILTYKVTAVNPNAVEVSACDKSATGVVTIGNSVKYFANDYAVTAIGKEAFSHCENLTSVDIPNSVTSIGMDAFAYSSFTSMVIPDSVTTLGQGVFCGCTSLSSVTIGSGVTSVPAYLFGWNHALRDVYVKGNITSVHADAFWKVSSKSEINVYLPDGSSKQPWIDAGLNSDKIWTGAVTGSIFTEGDLTYKITSTSPTTVAVSKCNTSAKNALSIPKSVNYAGKPYAVTSIGESAFGDCTGLTSITIPNSITAIGNNAFQHTAITTLSIPESVTSIGYNIVFDCGSLTSIEVSASNQNYSSDNGVLYNKNKTELIRYPQGKTATSFVIPDSVTSIGDHALYACTSLQSVAVPDAVSNIEIYAFDHCTSLTSINIPSSVTTIKVGTFNGCSSLPSIDIPYSVATIERDAFWGCTSLASATIGSSVSALDANAFNGDTNLKNLYVQGNITSIDGTSFSNVPTTNVKVHLLAGADQGVWTSAEFNVANIAYDATAPTFKDGVLTYKVTSVNPRTMEVSDCEESATGTVYISKSIKYGVNDYAVTAVGFEAFYFCVSLTSVSIPNSVASIEDRAFSNCGFTSVNIPDSVRTIGKSAFDSSQLSSVSIPNSVESIGMSAFECSSLRSVALPDSITTIEVNTFLGCDQLESIIIPDSVVDIGESAFENCYSLSSVTIPSSVATIGSFAFNSCSALDSIDLPDSLITIGNQAFYSCTKLKSIAIPDSVRTIEANAFESCTSMASITLGSKVDSLLTGTFSYNPSLKNIYVRGNVTSIHETAFTDVTTSNVNVYLPAGSDTKVWTDRGFVLDKVWVEAKKSTFTVGDLTYKITSLDPRKVEVSDCDSSVLGSIAIPEKVVYGTFNYDVIGIGYKAFSGCLNITSIDVPSSVESIDGEAFTTCTRLASITVNPDNKYYSSHDGVLYNKDKVQIVCCPAAKKDFAFPDSVTSIGRCAFYYCQYISSIVIPDSVTSIGSQAFYHCSSLSSVTLGSGITSLSANTFGWDDALTDIYVRGNVASIDLSVFFNTKVDNVTVHLPYGADAKVWADRDFTKFVTTCKVTFDGNGGEGTMDPQFFTSDTEQALAERTFTRGDEYSFLGWSEDKSATIATYSDKASLTFTEDTILYAIWAPKIKCDVPILSDPLSINAAGEVTAKTATFSSQSVVPLKVSAVKSQQLEGATALFANSDTINGVCILLTPSGGSEVKVPLNSPDPGETVDWLIAAKQDTTPGTLAVTFDLSLPKEAQLNYLANDGQVSIASLTYEVSAAPAS